MKEEKNKLQRWISKNVASDDMLWKGAWGDQMQFLRDRLLRLAAAGLHYEDIAAIPDVISTHRSKSIELPVCEFWRPDLDLRLIVRGNFHDWKLSVMSEKPVIADFSGLFFTTPPVEPDYTGDELHSVYFEGFPKDLVFGYYEPSDKKKWSACIGGEYSLYTTVFLIMRSLDAIKPAVWHTRESHRAELDADTARRKAREAQESP